MEPLSWGQIALQLVIRFLPVWAALIATFTLSYRLQAQAGALWQAV